jgi:hypothetical protein
MPVREPEHCIRATAKLCGLSILIVEDEFPQRWNWNTPSRNGWMEERSRDSRG